MDEFRVLNCDLLVVGGSAGGICGALRAAREGLQTVLSASTDRLGGVFPSLGAIETHYTERRSPIVAEIRERIEEHYRTQYGKDSEQYRTAVFLEQGNPMFTFEPSVAERVLEEMCAAEVKLEIIREVRPVSVLRAENRLLGVDFRDGHDGRSMRVYAGHVIDAGYTGDIVAAAGVPCRIGRESRSEYGEAHAGRVFTRWVAGKFPVEAAHGRLKIEAKSTTLGLLSGSSGEGDDNVMSYGYRLCLTDDPDNRIPIAIPENYKRERYRALTLTVDEREGLRIPIHGRFLNCSLEEMVAYDHLIHGHKLPNRKRSWNATNFPGAGKEYATADWNKRVAIERAHREHALGLLYFLQHDESVPETLRRQYREWGLAADEFHSSSHIPPQLYVREARRIVAREIMTENDAVVPAGLEATSPRVNSVAVTDFPMDSLACTAERVPGSLNDGQFFLQEATRPAQVPFGILLPTGLDNLLVPGAAGTTHVAWGTVRQTPTFMQLAEAAACATVLSHRSGIVAGRYPIARLQQFLADKGFLLSFLNDAPPKEGDEENAAMQYFGTKGFFASFDARPGDDLDEATFALWLCYMNSCTWTDGDARKLALSLSQCGPGEPLTCAAFIDRLSPKQRAAIEDSANMKTETSRLTRGEACRLLYNIEREGHYD